MISLEIGPVINDIFFKKIMIWLRDAIQNLFISFSYYNIEFCDEENGMN